MNHFTRRPVDNFRISIRPWPRFLFVVFRRLYRHCPEQVWREAAGHGLRSCRAGLVASARRGVPAIEPSIFARCHGGSAALPATGADASEAPLRAAGPAPGRVSGIARRRSRVISLRCWSSPPANAGPMAATEREIICDEIVTCFFASSNMYLY